ncbi:hypothetical protein R1sor_021360 [Riccia sorocarpa]|uniref:Desiccation-related protein PCC13-62 n=1 Tax=Riccia sorocarpa TaxID=122646 RepID=A0ABD3GJ04_9MARC
MSKSEGVTALSIVLLLLWTCTALSVDSEPDPCSTTLTFTETDKDLVAFALNLEYLEAEFFLFGAFGYGLDRQAPVLTAGGPPPIGGQKAMLDPLINDLVAQMALQEVGHIRVIRQNLGPDAFPRPLLNISRAAWATIFDAAFNMPLIPSFDPYASSINYMLASYAVPYVGLTGYVGANPQLLGSGAKSLVAGLLGVESGQDALIRTWLYERKQMFVTPYGFTVADATNAISRLRNDLDHNGLVALAGAPVPYTVDDEGLVVPIQFGSEQQTTGNILSADVDSLSYPRTPEQILSIVYSSGNPNVSGGFYPLGAHGRIAERYHKYGRTA